MERDTSLWSKTLPYLSCWWKPERKPDTKQIMLLTNSLPWRVAGYVSNHVLVNHTYKPLCNRKWIIWWNKTQSWRQGSNDFIPQVNLADSSLTKCAFLPFTFQFCKAVPCILRVYKFDPPNIPFPFPLCLSLSSYLLSFKILLKITLFLFWKRRGKRGKENKERKERKERRKERGREGMREKGFWEN